jgi:hypothetical protein
MKVKITKYQGRSCLRAAERIAKRERNSDSGLSGYALRALDELGYAEPWDDEHLFDLAKRIEDRDWIALDPDQMMTALCFAAAVAGVKP